METERTNGCGERTAQKPRKLKISSKKPFFFFLLFFAAAFTATGSAVRKVVSPEIARLPAKSRERTRTWYVVPGASPLSVSECAVTSAGCSAVLLPYAVVGPYSTSVSLGSLVVQMTVAPLGMGAMTIRPEITGGVVSLTEPKLVYSSIASDALSARP